MDIVQQTLDGYQEAKSNRSGNDGLYETIGRYVWPTSQDFSSVDGNSSGQTRTEGTYDSTAKEASHRMSSGIYSFLMPSGIKWFEFTSKDKDDQIALWLSHATSTTQSELNRSNFAREMLATIRSMIVFGTGVLSVERVKGDLIFRSYHLGNIFIEENYMGVVDTVYRRIRYTLRQAVQAYGLENLSEASQKNYKAGKLNDKVEFVHAVFPRTDYDKTKIDDKGKKFVSQHIEVAEKKLVKGGGFSSNPYKIGRYSKPPEELYGSGVGREMLEEIKMLSAMRRTFIESAEKEAAPPMFVESDSTTGQIVTEPNSIIYLQPGAMPPTPWKTGVSSQLTGMVVSDQQTTVRRGFSSDLFQSLADHQNMTATEVVGRQDETMNVIAPDIAVLQKDLLDPLMMRSMELVREMKKIDDLPTDKIDIELVYHGRLALAMSNMQTQATEITLAKWAPYNELAPILDNIDLDQAFRKSAVNTGVPAEFLRTMEQVQAIRQKRQEAAEEERQAAIAETASKAFKNVSGEVSPNSLAANLG